MVMHVYCGGSKSKRHRYGLTRHCDRQRLCFPASLAPLVVHVYSLLAALASSKQGMLRASLMHGFVVAYITSTLSMVRLERQQFRIQDD